MKGTMDGAKRNAEKVAQHILPDRPYHLSLSHDHQSPKPDRWCFTGGSTSTSSDPEATSVRLQYQTFLSDADRGILFTLPPWVVHEEQPQMPVKPIAKVGEVKKKLSLAEHLSRKKSPQSPMNNNNNNEPPQRTESRINGGTVHAKPLPPPPIPREREVPKKESARPVDKSDARRTEARAESRTESRSERPRQELNGERYVEEPFFQSGFRQHDTNDMTRSRSSLPAKPPTDDSRKRAVDPESSLPPQKRLKNDTVTSSKTEQSRQSKPEPSRGRERTNERTQREAKDNTLHPSTNGLGSLISDRDRENTASPRSTIQVNGSRVRSDSGTSTPRAITKSTLPELLSPLHPSIFEGELEQRPRKKLADKAPPRSQKADAPPPTKKRKTTIIPELLSPTLPAIVEEALAKHTPSRSQASSQASDSPSSARKTITVASSVPSLSLTPAVEDKPIRPSRIVTIKLKKAMAKRAKELLSLPSKSAKDALRKERSISVDSTPPPPPARKRPRAVEDALEATPPAAVVSKRGRLAAADTIAAKPAGPATPLKHAAVTMSRVTSNQSQGNTPGNTTGLTPGNTERPPTRSAEVVLDPATRAQIELSKERQSEFTTLGTKLKHMRDALVKKETPNPPSSSDERRICALHLEMVLAYMVAFQQLNHGLVLRGRPGDVQCWESLLPHFSELKHRVRQHRVLRALAAQLHAVCLEQIVNTFFTLDQRMVAETFARYSAIAKRRPQAWMEANANLAAVDDNKMKASSMGGGTGVDEAVGLALGIMRRWADRERVPWTSEIAGPLERDVKKDHRERERKEPDRDRDNNNRGGGREREQLPDRERERDNNRDPRDRDGHRERDNGIEIRESSTEIGRGTGRGIEGGRR
ncbi:hypothetical protein QBC35DRAFT_86871 [Podospora australis]|uniref:Uncharacterized protein n=1 Tax=Podospora australis TaxID=1536484 RepID=A0AAN6X1A1_9PEZI|nr:hypothetical protein QBC35DRAFT_86871 [Podospora australis]